MTSLGTLAADVWNATTRTLTALNLSSVSPWTVVTSNFGQITAGSYYHPTIFTEYNGVPTDSLNIPTVTISDPASNVIVNGASMTRTGTGTYTYSYLTSGNARAGTWTTLFSATVEAGKTLPGIDNWTVVTSPAQVIINNISSNTVPMVSANVTITDEGLSGNEYQYQWCVVSNASDTCGNANNVFDATAAKYINAGEDFNTNLTATVPTPGDYYFKMIVYFGTESSGSSRSFTALAGNPVISHNGGGGGGGSPNPSAVSANPSSYKSADFTDSGHVNSVDFSILLYFWGAKHYLDVAAQAVDDTAALIATGQAAEPEAIVLPWRVLDQKHTELRWAIEELACKHSWQEKPVSADVTTIRCANCGIWLRVADGTVEFTEPDPAWIALQQG